MSLTNNQQAFFSLVKAGLWERDVHFSYLESIDLLDVYRIAEEQSVVGLVSAGLEHIQYVKIPQEMALSFVGSALQIEQRNTAMNAFVAKLIEKLRKEGIYAILVKGQGIAQCYERPLWRASGDVDLLLDETNYKKAYKVLIQYASNVEEEKKDIRHIGMSIGPWEIELHGTLCGLIRKSVDVVLKEVQNDTFSNKEVRLWNYLGTQIPLPSVDNDIVFVFGHIYQHFFKEGIGLRQICDWCRLLWTYKDEIDKPLLESRLKRMHLMDIWQAFAVVAVDYLGMPENTMPFYDSSDKYKRKAGGVVELMMEAGNFGRAYNKDYKHKCNFLFRSVAAFSHHTRVAYKHYRLFPYDSFLGWVQLISIGVKTRFKRVRYR